MEINTANNEKLSTRKLALGGLLLALVVIVLYFGSLLPTAKLSVFVLASFLTAASVIELGKRFMWIFYFAAVILIFIVMPDKLKALTFIGFFGLYPVLRVYFDRISNVILSWVAKLIYFNLFLGLVTYFYGKLFLSSFNISQPILVVFVVGQFAFIAYDILFSYFIHFYFNNVKKYIR